MRWLRNGESAHYNIAQLSDIQQVKDIFVSGPDALNWLFTGTSGVHGDCTKPWDKDIEFNEFGECYITILIVHPRLVCMKYGQLKVSKEDLKWLWKMTNKTVKIIKEIHSK